MNLCARSETASQHSGRKNARTISANSKMVRLIILRDKLVNEINCV